MRRANLRIRRGRTSVLGAAAVACVVAAVAALAAAGRAPLGSDDERSADCPAFEAPARPWLLVGSASALTPYCGKLIAVAGTLAPRTGAFAKLSARNGTPSADYAQVLDGSVRAAVGDGNGGWFVGGDFAQVDGKECRFLAHILRNGSHDASWCPRPGAPVNALARRGTSLFVGGEFSSVLDEKRFRLAAVDTRRPVLRAWAPAVSGRPVYDRTTLIPRHVSALAVRGRTLYVGGFFEAVAGRRRENVAAVDAATGRVLPWSVRVGGPRDFAPTVRAILATPRALYIVGSFEQVGGTKRGGAAAVGYDGRVARWDPAPRASYRAGGVRTIARLGDDLVLGGQFVSIRGSRRPALAVVSATTGAPTAWRAPLTVVDVSAVAVARDRLYVAGAASQRDDAETQIFALRRSHPRLAWTGRPDVGNGPPGVAVLAAAGDSVFAGGALDHVRPAREQTTLATIDLANRTVRHWSASFRGEYGAYAPNAVVVAGDILYAGGGFSTVNGRPRSGLAAFDARTGALLDWHPPTMGGENYGVTALAADDERLYVGGDFASWSGALRRSIAAFDLETARLEEWGSPITSRHADDGTALIHALRVDEETVYVGGEFDRAGDQRRAGIAAFGRASGDLLDWDPNLEQFNGAYALEVRDDVVYVGGWCISCDDGEHNGVQAIDAAGRVRALGPSLAEGESEGQLHALALDRSRLLIAGQFTRVGDAPRPGLAAIDASTGELGAWRPAGRLSPIRGVRDVVLAGNVLVVAGEYGGELAVYPLPAASRSSRR